MQPSLEAHFNELDSDCGSVVTQNVVKKGENDIFHRSPVFTAAELGRKERRFLRTKFTMKTHKRQNDLNRSLKQQKTS